MDGIIPCPGAGSRRATIYKAEEGKFSWTLHYKCPWCKKKMTAERKKYQHSVFVEAHGKRVSEAG